MAMIGHGAAVAEMGKHHHELHGSIAFAAWLGVHAWLLNTTRARIDAFINWAWDSFSNNRGPAIIDDPTPRASTGTTPPTSTAPTTLRIHRNSSSKGSTLMIENARTKVFWLMVVLTIVFVVLTVVHSIWWLIGVVIARRPGAVGIWDLLQTKHSILRNYPIVGHARFLLEDAGPELHQYLVENDTDGRPFNRDTRSLMYQRAKSVPDKKPFGTELDVYADGYTFMMHSVAPHPMPADPVDHLRITVGGPQCSKPYSLSVLNISAMSFGALGSAAVKAMNTGAKLGRFAHDTGEGGLSKHHLEPGGDVIWQIGTGYFGCRTAGRRLQPRAVPEERRPRPGQDDRDQGVAGREARATAASCPAPRSPRRSPRPASCRSARTSSPPPTTRRSRRRGR